VKRWTDMAKLTGTLLQILVMNTPKNITGAFSNMQNNSNCNVLHAFATTSLA
jgi:hypothetical protein